MEELVFPNLPCFSKSKIEDCRNHEDFRPIFFEIYKHIAIVCSLISCIDRDSPGIKKLSKAKHGVLVGLLNRCSRLILANVVLSSEQKLGETTTIIDRCIQESAINVRWICKYENDNSFERFLINGLKKDLALEKNINEKIKERNGEVLEIEKRMLASIDRCINLAEIKRKDFDNYKRFPTFETRLNNLEHNNDDLSYIVTQRIGSHHVHGTWTSLLTHYLDEINGDFTARDNLVSIHVNQFISVSLEVLEMLKDYIKYISLKQSFSEDYLNELENIRDLLDTYRLEIRGKDFDVI